jgi:hypothetical protein
MLLVLFNLLRESLQSDGPHRATPAGKFYGVGQADAGYRGIVFKAETGMSVASLDRTRESEFCNRSKAADQTTTLGRPGVQPRKAPSIAGWAVYGASSAAFLMLCARRAFR